MITYSKSLLLMRISNLNAYSWTTMLIISKAKGVSLIKPPPSLLVWRLYHRRSEDAIVLRLCLAFSSPSRHTDLATPISGLWVCAGGECGFVPIINGCGFFFFFFFFWGGVGGCGFVPVVAVGIVAAAVVAAMVVVLLLLLLTMRIIGSN